MWIISEFLNEGQKTEVRFANDISYFGSVDSATRLNDITEHWDKKLTFNQTECPLKNGKESVTFDVKGLKKIKRSDKNVTEDYHYVELINVDGNPGSLYGKADFMVFETHHYWIIVDRLELINFIESKLSRPVYCFNDPIIYTIYKRKNRLDELMLVETKELEKLSKLIILKHDEVQK